jgi:hypothetical protein
LLAPELDSISGVVEPNDLFVDVISPANETKMLDVDAGFGEFSYGLFRSLMIGENGDDGVNFCHLTLLREETASSNA